MYFANTRLLAPSKLIANCVCAVLLVICGFLLVPRAEAAQAEELLSRAEEQGKVRVIVRLRGDFRAEGMLSSFAAAQGQRQFIQRVQNQLLDRVGSPGLTRIKKFRHIPYLAMEVDARALAQLAADPAVISVEEDIPVPPTLSESIPIIGADTAWSAGYSGNGQVVVILDTGVDKNHSFLSGKVVSEACYSSNTSFSSSLCPGSVELSTASGSGLNCNVAIRGCDHGTHVAGIAAGSGPSFSGVAKDAKIIAVQVFSRFDESSFCGAITPCVLSYTSDQIQGLERVLALSSSYDIASVNMSLGGGRYTNEDDCDSANSAMKSAIDNLRSVGIATVIASGNNGYVDSMTAPGCISTAVSVGSTNKLDAISSFSNEAIFLSLYAPGEVIFSSVPFDSFAFKMGTSMATPHVAGAWAVIKQKAPYADVDRVLSSLATTGQPIVSTLGTWTTSRIHIDSALDTFVIPDPRMSVESPSSGATVGLPFVLSGWAVDLAASSGTGVDRVRVTANPARGGGAIPLGDALYGLSRPDVGTALGSSQFDNSGFRLPINGPLEPGGYTFVVEARSTVTGTYNNVFVVDATVEANTLVFLEAPADGKVVQAPFVLWGWAFNTGTTSGTGIDFIDAWAVPESDPGNPIFLGNPTLGVDRQDVADVYGGLSNYAPSGFGLTIWNLDPGDYTLQLNVHTTVTGDFDATWESTITVSSERMFVETPTHLEAVSSPFTLSGWAVDQAAISGPGVDAVNVTAFPLSGGPGVFVGSATMGLPRPDVGAYFGGMQFDDSGFSLEVTLPPDDYVLAVYARSTVTGAFTNVFVRRITVSP